VIGDIGLGVVAVVLLGESMTLVAALGVGLTLFGVYLMARPALTLG